MEFPKACASYPPSKDSSIINIISGSRYDECINELTDSANYQHNLINEQRFKDEKRKEKNDNISEGMLRYWRKKKKSRNG